MKTSDGVLALLLLLGLLALHLQQMPLLSGSVREFWTRSDHKANLSKLFFALCLFFAALAAVWPFIGALLALSLCFAHAILAMHELK